MDKSEKLWDMLAKSFDKSETSSEPIHIKTMENTKKYLKSNDLVLDYGCATGIKTLEIAGHVNKIYGMDISSKMIELAKKKATEQKIANVDFIKGIILDDRFELGSFDVILTFNILHLLKDCPKALHRINELLKPGGLFISATPCIGERMTFSTKVKFYISRISVGLVQYVKSFKFEEVENLITNADFQIDKTEIFFHELSCYFIVARKK
jgi:2-polyprenyl-3-methyl-5-hydroxy-6-metoxy-1,4-benzoquinol methylase